MNRKVLLLLKIQYQVFQFCLGGWKRIKRNRYRQLFIYSIDPPFRDGEWNVCCFLHKQGMRFFIINNKN